MPLTAVWWVVQGFVSSVRFFDTSSHLISGSNDATVMLWDVGAAVSAATTSATASASAKPAPAPASAAAPSKQPESKSPVPSAPLRTFTGHQSGVSCLAVQPANASGGAPGSGSGKGGKGGAANGGVVNSKANVSPHVFVSGGYDGACKVWDTRVAERSGCVQTMVCSDMDVNAVTWFPNGRQCVMGWVDR
jgi:WD40 repeat protein